MNEYEKILVSCIVPVYKVPQEYLKECIESLINQTLKKIEIILIDDGSPDNCGEICEEYAKIDRRIKVIHQKNKGLSGARNSGLNIANGQYVTYVDGDDYLEKNGLERLYNYSKKDEYDVIRGQFFRDSGSKIEKIHTNNVKINKLYNGKEDIVHLKREVLNYNSKISTVWGALYNRKLLIKYKIYNDEDIKQGAEEFVFDFNLYNHVKKAIFTDEYFYHYRYNDSSISTFSTEENNYMVLKGFEKVLQSIKENDIEYYEQLYYQFNIRILFVIVTTFISGYFNPKNTEKMSVKRKQISKYLKQDIVKDALKYKYIKNLDIKRKITVFCIKCRMFLIVNLFGKIRYKQKH